VGFRLGGSAALIDRGAVFSAAHHAFGLYRWFSAPDAAQQAAIAEAAAHLDSVAAGHSPLLGAALGVPAWLDRDGEQPPLRAALGAYWPRRGVTTLPCPLLTGARALHAEVPWAREVWIGHFLDALAEEAEDGIALLVTLERHWFAARRAVAGRRRDSRSAAAIDILAAAPLLSATSLGQAVGMATKNATRLLEGFVVLGIASEVTHRSKRRLYGLKHLAPLREAAAPPRRPLPGRRPGRPSGSPFPTVTETGRGRHRVGPGPLPSPAPARTTGIRICRARQVARSSRPGDPACTTSSRRICGLAAVTYTGLTGLRVDLGTAGVRRRVLLSYAMALMRPKARPPDLVGYSRWKQR
jgi:hypothetical protein